MRTKTQAALLESREALTQYLDSLFRDSPTETESQLATTPESIDAPDAITVSPVAEAAAVAPRTPLRILTEPTSCAILRVGDLRLATPLVEIFGIRRQSERLCRLPNLPAWTLGISVAAAGQKVQVVDTAVLLSPTHQHGEFKEMYIVIIAPDRWALACDGIEKTILVAPDQVRWRTPGEEAPWFSGVISAELCPFIDVPALVNWLDAAIAARSQAACEAWHRECN